MPAVTQGDPGNEFFVLLSGSVDVSIASENGTDITRVATLQSGTHFGELALEGPANTPRRATVTCRERCVFAVLHRRAYDRCSCSSVIRILTQVPAEASGCLYGVAHMVLHIADT